MHLVESLAHHSMILKAAGVKKVESMSQCRRTEAVNVKERLGQTGINVRIFSDDGKRFAKVATSLGKHAHVRAKDTNIIIIKLFSISSAFYVGLSEYTKSN